MTAYLKTSCTNLVCTQEYTPCCGDSTREQPHWEALWADEFSISHPEYFRWKPTSCLDDHSVDSWFSVFQTCTRKDVVLLNLRGFCAHRFGVMQYSRRWWALQKLKASYRWCRIYYQCCTRLQTVINNEYLRHSSNHNFDICLLNNPGKIWPIALPH